MDLHKTCEKIPKQTASIQYSGPLQEKKKKKTNKQGPSTKGKTTTMRDHFRKKEKRKQQTNKEHVLYRTKELNMKY
jgi:tartrate dehydratase beta subunit/fumarate hydratase class I family protein